VTPVYKWAAAAVSVYSEGVAWRSNDMAEVNDGAKRSVFPSMMKQAEG